MQTFKVRVSVSSTDSISASRSAIYLFELIIKHKCADNKIALDASLANARIGTVVSGFTYTIGATQIDRTPLISTINTNADCPIASKLLSWNDPTNAWVDQTAARIAPYNTWISGFDATTGKLSVHQA